jgi:16S rRNA (cytosine1402-N4)-methyltransferase
VLFDLGVSSMQLDEAARGFAYALDAPLDMRMDQSRGRSAAEVVNTYDAASLARILRVYGEEKFARQIASAIVRERAKSPITSSARLAELVRSTIPAPARRTGGHPAKRTFQALRIEVNGELDALSAALPAALDRLAIGGRAVVLSYHSLEDRLVKQAMAVRARSSAPVDLPVEPAGSGPRLRLLTRGAELPSDAEVAANPRAASVRLRAAERIDERKQVRVTGRHQPGTRGGAERRESRSRGGGYDDVDRDDVPSPPGADREQGAGREPAARRPREPGAGHPRRAGADHARRDRAGAGPPAGSAHAGSPAG